MKIEHTKIKNIFKNGEKPVFKMTLQDGKQIECTNDHRFLFKNGWKSLKEETGLDLSPRGKVAFWNESKDHYIYVNGIVVEEGKIYQNKEWLNEQYNILNKKIQNIADETNISYHTIKKWITKHNLQHSKGGRKGNEPWNKGKTYKTGHKQWSKEHIEAIKKARSGEKSNFWKGGVTKERANIGRWTGKQAYRIHEKNGWTCQLCLGAGFKKLNCHHIIPVWYDEDFAKDINNLTTLCKECHKKVNKDELKYIKTLSGKPPIITERKKKPRAKQDKVTVSKLSKILKFEYIGKKETYDIEVEGPHHNFIANGIVTHNSVNERSSRYSIIDDGAQQAGVDGWRVQARTNKQGSSGFFEKEDGEICSQDEKDLHEKSMEIYNKRINMGMAREQARKDLPLCSYTEAYWEVNLRSLFNFLFLRMDSHAQYEIRQYANIIAENIVSKWVPVAWKAFQDYQLNAMTLSAIDIELINIKSGLERFKKAIEIGWIDKKFSDNYKTNKLTEKLPFNLERKEFNEKAKRLGLKDPFYLNILGLKD